jgi:predicted MPP superfamily phosphohydrolase
MITLRAIRFTLTMVVLSGGGHWILVRWMTRAFPRTAPHRRALLGLGALAVLVPIVARFFAVTTRASLAETVQAYGTMEMMLALLGALPLLVIQGLTALVTRGSAAPSLLRGAPDADTATDAPEDRAVTDRAQETDAVDAFAPFEAPLSRRQMIERAGGLLVLGTTATTLGWGTLRGRHAFAVEEVPVRIAGLPRALDGYTIAQVSDIHVGVFVGDRELREGLDRVRAMRPDMVVATGDLVDYDPRYAAQMARALGDLTPRDGVFAILGNHDYYTGAEAVKQALSRSGVHLLMNEGLRIRPADGGGFALLGVDDYAGFDVGSGPDLRRAMAMVPEDRPRILLAHQPKFFDRSASKVALQLSGHTHGGQINIGVRPVDLFMKYVAGRYDRGGSALWVNRGFGVAGPPARIGAPPEITKIVLVAA